jgi:hypothetical protein
MGLEHVAMLLGKLLLPVDEYTGHAHHALAAEDARATRRTGAPPVAGLLAAAGLRGRADGRRLGDRRRCAGDL